jgi:anti-anti-sigma factor
MGVQLEIDPDLTIMRLDGPFLGDSECEEIRHRFRQLVSEGNLKLIVDLDAVQDVSCRALGVLVEMHMHYVNFGGQMVLANLYRRVEDLLVTTGLACVFWIGPTMALARARCR